MPLSILYHILGCLLTAILFTIKRARDGMQGLSPSFLIHIAVGHQESIYHPTRFKKLMTSTLNSKYATDVLIFELDNVFVLHNRGLQAVAGRLLRAIIMRTNQSRQTCRKGSEYNIVAYPSHI
ncbi:hypothetical protein PILCRDRAFT_605971 [Piloderma croceum F 1598]|uniref:Uncharacterized protein n=1 Tax=Piloderma croceum (strain F 1598) TaxID=765440 RepID=A0A0C3FDP6_PILCF|nr:hypothetical protein PILCRDRAFT_605971 [Piloderma croceum F 1598]